MSTFHFVCEMFFEDTERKMQITFLLYLYSLTFKKSKLGRFVVYWWCATFLYRRYKVRLSATLQVLLTVVLRDFLRTHIRIPAQHLGYILSYFRLSLHISFDGKQPTQFNSVVKWPKNQWINQQEENQTSRVNGQSSCFTRRKFRVIFLAKTP